MFHNGKWGSICNDGYTVYYGKVICRMLGFSTRYAFVSYGYSFPKASHVSKNYFFPFPAEIIAPLIVVMESNTLLCLWMSLTSSWFEEFFSP